MKDLAYEKYYKIVYRNGKWIAVKVKELQNGE